MRDTRTVQLSIFDFYAQHEMGMQLERMSDVLDSYPFLTLVEADLKVNGGSELGRKALTVDSVFRCMILKQMLGVSYPIRKVIGPLRG